MSILNFSDLNNTATDPHLHAQQKMLMDDLHHHIEEGYWHEVNDSTLIETTEEILQTISLRHPKTSEAVKNLLRVLEDIGI